MLFVVWLQQTGSLLFRRTEILGGRGWAGGLPRRSARKTNEARVVSTTSGSQYGDI